MMIMGKSIRTVEAYDFDNGDDHVILVVTEIRVDIRKCMSCMFINTGFKNRF